MRTRALHKVPESPAGVAGAWRGPRWCRTVQSPSHWCTSQDAEVHPHRGYRRFVDEVFEQWRGDSTHDVEQDRRRWASDRRRWAGAAHVVGVFRDRPFAMSHPILISVDLQFAFSDLALVVLAALRSRTRQS